MRRNETIDIAKGIGIVLVVIGHLSGVVGTTGPLLLWIKSFLYQFHVPLFFFLSGLFYKPGEKWKPFLIKKVRRLYLPYLVANIVFLVVDIIFRIITGIEIIWINDIKHAAKIVLGIGLTPLGGATWFLIASLRAVIFYKLIKTAFGDKPIIASLLCFSIGILGLFVTGKYAISSSMVAIAFYWLGDLCKCYVIKMQDCSLGTRALLFSSSLVFLVLLRPYNFLDVSAAFYGNRICAIIGSCIGIIMVLSLSDLFKGQKCFSKTFRFLGERTMSVLIGHFAAFKIVVIVQVLFRGVSSNYILSHPCYDVSGLWSVLYFFVGVVVPLAVSSKGHIKENETYHFN